MPGVVPDKERVPGPGSGGGTLHERLHNFRAMRGRNNTTFRGRFEILMKNLDVIIDGAHTLEGMRLLKSTFRRSIRSQTAPAPGYASGQELRGVGSHHRSYCQGGCLCRSAGSKTLDPGAVGRSAGSLNVPASPAAGDEF